MPYIITTHPTIDGAGQTTTRLEEELTTRHAVATLEEAQQDARNLIEDRAQAPGWTDDYAATRNIARTLPEKGGTVGPLPDGTVIEVEQVCESTLYNAIRPTLCCPTCGIQRTHISGSHLIAAYNAAQEV